VIFGSRGLVSHGLPDYAVEIVLSRWSSSRENRDYIRILYKKQLAFRARF